MASLRVSGTYKTNFIVFKLLQSVPLINIAQVSQEIQISIPTINAAFDRLQELGIVREITDRQRDKLYSYERLYQSPLIVVKG